MNPMSAWLLVSGQNRPSNRQTRRSGLVVTEEGNGQLSLAWNAVTGAAGYNLYRSPVSGGGWVKVNTAPLSGDQLHR